MGAIEGRLWGRACIMAEMFPWAWKEGIPGPRFGLTMGKAVEN